MIKYTDYNKQYWKQNKGNRFVIDEMGQMAIPDGFSLSVFWKLFYLYWNKGLFWFRFFDGYGLSGESNKQRRFILFSERNGLVKTYKLFGWTFKILTP